MSLEKVFLTDNLNSEFCCEFTSHSCVSTCFFNPLSEFQKIYDRLSIHSKEIGESFYQTRMEKIVKDLEERGNAICCWCLSK